MICPSTAFEFSMLGWCDFLYIYYKVSGFKGGKGAGTREIALTWRDLASCTGCSRKKQGIASPTRHNDSPNIRKGASIVISNSGILTIFFRGDTWEGRPVSCIKLNRKPNPDSLLPFLPDVKLFCKYVTIMETFKVQSLEPILANCS